MIIDCLQNWKSYKFSQAWEKAFNFLLSLGPEIEDGEHPVCGNEIFARVMTYKTRRPETGLLEAHRKYTDIQIVLSGRETIECFPLEGLAHKTEYDESKDAVFFHRPPYPAVRLELKPGVFAAFFPQDAHMTSLTAADVPETVKKVVIKIDTNIL